AWIQAGAPEQPIGGATAPASTFVWQDGVDKLIGDKCAACHVAGNLGGLSLKTYADALKGGKSGPAIVPGNPDKSIMIQIQQSGNHAALFASDELAKIIEWIKAGAPETAAPVAAPAAPGATPTAVGPTPTLAPTATPTPFMTPTPTDFPTPVPD
ncbi:MAG: c-type cytochrome domain-containing protein, partial [Anaerolineae bacterium]